MKKYNTNSPKEVFDVFAKRCKCLDPTLKDYSMCFENITDVSNISINALLTPDALDGSIVLDAEDQEKLTDIVNCCSCDNKDENKDNECQKSCELYKQLIKKHKINR